MPKPSVDVGVNDDEQTIRIVPLTVDSDYTVEISILTVPIATARVRGASKAQNSDEA